MRRTVKHERVHRALAMFLAIVMTLSLLPLSVLAVTPATVSTNISEIDFVVGKQTVFTIGTEANDDAGKMVTGTAVFSNPDAIEKLEYYEIQDGNWYPLEGDFGPATGFPMTDATSTFRVTFREAGIFSVEIFIKSVEDGSVVCSTTATAVVNGSSSFTTDADEKTFVVNEPTEFTFTTVANEDAGKMVIGTAEFSDPDAIKTLEYYEVQDGNWYPLEGDFGPATGFPMSNATSTFRVTFNQAGTYTLTAYMKEVETGDTLCCVMATVTVKERSAISFEKESIEIKYTDANAINNTLVDKVEGAEYTYKSDNESIVKVSEYGVLTPMGIGEAKITVTRKENNGFVAASTSYNVKVVPGDQGDLVWENTVPDSIKWNDPNGYVNTVKGGSGDGSVTYSSNNTDIAEVDAVTGMITLKKPGMVTITATKSGGTLYEDKTADYTLNVVKSEQNPLAFDDDNPNAIFVGDEYLNAATGGYAGGVVQYESSDNTIATVDENGKVTALRVPIGKESAVVTITATLAGNDYYEGPITASYTLTIYRAAQDTPLVFEKGTEGQKIKYGQEYTNAVTGGNTTPISYKSSDNDIATVDGNGKVTALKAGTVTITASAPQTEEYESQELSYQIVIELADQTVTFAKGNTTIPAITYGDSYQNKASANTAITYVSSDPTVADVDADGNLIIKKAGTVTITATAAATEQYAKAEDSYTITINKANQTITFDKGEDVEVTFNDNENKFSNPASSNATQSNDAADKDGIKITYTIAFGEEFVVDGSFDPATGVFEIKGAGTVVVTVSFTANDRFNDNMASYTLVIKKDDQSIAFDKTTYEMTNGDNSFVAPVAKEKGDKYGTGKIVYTIQENADNVVSGIDSTTGALTFTNKTGKVTILATKLADDNYNETTATYTLTVTDAQLGDSVFHTVVGDKINDSGWFTGNVSIQAAEGYLLSYSANVDAAKWENELKDAVTEDGIHQVTFHVKEMASGKIYQAQTVTIKKDATDPTAKINHKNLTSWEKFLSIITLGMWEKEKMDFTITSGDVTSGMEDANVKYIVVEGTTELMDEATLNGIADDEWKSYTGSISVESDKIFVVYAKVTDNAGRHIYATTNGVVFDRTAVSQDNIVVDINTEDKSGFYNEDVVLDLQITDAEPSSGINKVTYEVLNNGKQTQSGTLFQFEVENPKYSDLISVWSTSEDNRIVVDAKSNNSDFVVVKVTVEDNAGNTTTKEIPLKICVDEPTLNVSYIDQPNSKKDTANEVTYFNAKREAKIVITGRTTVFNASARPVITVTESRGTTADGSTYEVIDWVTAEVKDNPDAATHTYIVKFNGSAQYELDVQYADIFDNRCSYESEKFAVDLDEPTASISIDEHNTWTKLLETLTFGLWSNQQVTVKAESTDATGEVKSMMMYKTDSTAIMTSEDLNALYESGEFVEYQDITVDKDEKFVVYIRVEDYAGRYGYICSDGFVVDMADAQIALTPETTDLSHNGIPLYNGDVNVLINVVEMKDEVYSGIKEVKYWVTCDGKTTQEKVLYSFNYSMDDYVAEGKDVPTYDKLLHKFSETVTILAEKNNSCDVELFVGVTDNAGNYDEKSIKVDIDKSAPEIKVIYDNNVPNQVVGDRGYYPANRKAIITITERAEHFEPAKALAGIQVKAVDFDGNPISVNGQQLEVDADDYLTNLAQLFGNVAWESKEGETPDLATHTLELPYNYDANYTFAIEYSDRASNINTQVDTADQQTPYKFTVDKLDPTASITVKTNTWDKLLEVLTFGLYSKEAVEVSANTDDATSPILSVEYYKTDATQLLTLEELEAVNTWTDITADPQFDITADERFTVYLKVTDYAGNDMYINSDGYIVDMTDAMIELIPEKTELSHNGIPLYTGDVDVLINVEELMDKAYSGIQEVKYWVKCDGVISQEEQTLFSFNYSKDNYVAGGEDLPRFEDLVHEFSETVTIIAQKNNSCDVELFVGVTDNAGNYTERSVKVDIDITDPTIDVTFTNNTPNKVVGDKGYFAEEREATVVITERPGHFDAMKATESIIITAKDSKGKAVIENCAELVGSWETNGTGNTATHTAVVDFSADANYEFTLSYEDLAKRVCTYEEVTFAAGTATPRYFAVDTVDPVGTVEVGNLGTWDKLIKILTFGLWSKEEVQVTGTSDDATSPIESVTYIKVQDTTALTGDELKARTDWQTFDGENGFPVAPDEKFVVYIRIEDFAGNVKFISTDGIVVDNTPPTVEQVKPEITILPEFTQGIYNSDVIIGVSVKDPKVGDTNAYAGLQQIRYEVYNLGEMTQQGILYSFEYTKANNPQEKNTLKVFNQNYDGKTLVREDYTPTYADLCPEWIDADAITVQSELNNSNDVKIVVYAVDNAGNENKAECEIAIDITPAEIEVTYDNNDGDTTFADGTFFKTGRTAKIVVTERNFIPENFKFQITNPHGFIPVISAWETVEGTAANGDDTIHTAYIHFEKDGDYEFVIESCLDAGLNANEAPTTGDSLAPWSFTVDLKAPVVSVTYDNVDVRNGLYYNAQRIATITVVEHNFETSRVVLKLAATDDGVATALPTTSKWVSNGDVHTMTITYAADARYVFDFDYTDKAGHKTADIAEQTFYVDKTNPTLTIEKIVDESANNDEGDIGFVMTAKDTNFDVFNPVLTAVVKNGDSFVTKQLEIGEISDIKNGKVFTVTNIEADGIYRITCTLVDKAGNAYSEVTLEKADGTQYVEQRAGDDTLVTFSINRDGSTFEIDENTANVVKQYYVQNVVNDIVVVEINADPLKQYAVTLNGKTLEEGKDYTVTEEGGNGSWMKYTYKISKDLFADEGEYKLVVSSKDKADNDAFSDVKDATIAFVVDRTAPVVTISGIANNGRYQTESQRVTLIPTDDGGALKSLVVNMVDKDGNVIKEVIDLTGQALEDALEANSGSISFEISEGLYQNVRIICTDCAAGETEVTNTFDTTVENVSVSTSVFMIFWANKSLRWGTIGGVSAAVIGLIVFIVLKKKKSKAE